MFRSDIRKKPFTLTMFPFGFAVDAERSTTRLKSKKLEKIAANGKQIKSKVTFPLADYRMADAQ